MTDETSPLGTTMPVAPAREPRRRRGRWIVVVAIVAVLAVAAWFAGEALARMLLVNEIRDRLVTRLALPEDQEIDIDVSGQVLPQLIAGRLDTLRIRSDDVSLGGVTGDIDVTATDLPIRGDESAGSIVGTATFDIEQVRALMDKVDSLPVPIDRVEFDGSSVAATARVEAFGAALDIGVSLAPRADAGDIVLRPTMFRIQGVELTADAVVAQFGALASTVVRDWRVCVAQYFPRGVTISDIEVVRDELVVYADIDGAIMNDTTLRQRGTCD